MFFKKIFNNHQLKRLLAFLVDILVVIIIGLTVGFVFGDRFALMGDNAIWIGFFVILLYHGILNSSINRGRTLGKMLFNIEVCSSSGKYLPLWKSLLRSLFVITPFYHEGSTRDLVSDFSNDFFNNTFDLITGTLAFSHTYLFLFNRRTLQSLHDLVFDSKVLFRTEIETTEIQKVNKLHFISIMVFLLYFAFSNNVSLGSLKDMEEILNNSILPTYLNIKKVEGVVSSKVSIVNDKVFINVKVHDEEMLGTEYACKISNVAINHLNIDHDVPMKIIIAHGYDIGIFWSWDHYKMELPLNKWKELIKRKIYPL